MKMKMKMKASKKDFLYSLGILTLFSFFILQNVVNAKTGDEGKIHWAYAQDIGVLSGCDGVALNTTNDCGGTGGFYTEGYSKLKLEVDYTYSSGSGWEFYLEGCDEGHATADCTDAADWYRVPMKTPIAGTGVKLSQGPIYETITADSKVIYVADILARRYRIIDFQATGSPGAGDVGTITAYVYRISY